MSQGVPAGCLQLTRVGYLTSEFQLYLAAHRMRTVRPHPAARRVTGRRICMAALPCRAGACG